MTYPISDALLKLNCRGGLGGSMGMGKMDDEMGRGKRHNPNSRPPNRKGFLHRAFLPFVASCESSLP